jgi:hypothetical protein
VEGSCEHGNELPDSIKCWEVLSSLATGVASRTPLSVVSNSDYNFYLMMVT